MYNHCNTFTFPVAIVPPIADAVPLFFVSGKKRDGICTTKIKGELKCREYIFTYHFANRNALTAIFIPTAAKARSSPLMWMLFLMK